MKKFLLTLAALVACSMTMWAEAELTVCDSTATNANVPINGLWVDNTGIVCQCLYPAEMISDMNGKEITAIKFYLNDNGIKFNGCTLEFYMGETDQTMYESATAVEGLTLVKTMAFTSADFGMKELLLELDNPYYYRGGNLVFESRVVVKGSYATTVFLGKNQENNQSFSRSSMYKFLPKATFTYGEKLPYNVKLNPEELSFGKVALQSEKTLNLLLRNYGTEAVTPSLSSLEAPFSSAYTPAELASGATVEIPVTFAPTEPGDYTATLTIDCGEAGTFNVPLSGFSVNESELTLCDGTEQSAYFPIYGYWFDNSATMSQMLYPAEMLAEIAGCQVTGVRFYPAETVGFNNGDLTLSMSETDIVQYESAGISSYPTNAVSDLTPVSTITVAGGEEVLEFPFDAPVTYVSGTLALQCNVSRTGGYQSTYFLGVNADEGVYMSCGKYSTNNLSSRFMPKITLLYIPKDAVETVTVTGVVTDTDQQPLEGVDVTITSTVRASLFTGETDANGAYSIEVTPEEGATYSIKFEKEGYKPQVLENVNLDDVQNVVMELDNVTGISTIATEGGKVQYVNVMGQVSDQPFQGVNIVLRDGKAIGKAIY